MGNVRSARIVDSALRKKGFRRVMDGKHIWYHFLKTNGKDSDVKVMMSHGMGNSTISAKLIADMAKQLYLTKSQFLDLIDCTLDEKGYREILEKQGLAV